MAPQRQSVRVNNIKEENGQAEGPKESVSKSVSAKNDISFPPYFFL